jgi:hypothetical protein
VEIVMDNAAPSTAGGALSQNAIARVESKAVVGACVNDDDDDDDDDDDGAPDHPHSNASSLSSSSSSSSSLITMGSGSRRMMDTSSMAALPAMRQVSSDSSILLLTARTTRISKNILPNLTRDTRWQTISTTITTTSSSSSVHNATWEEKPTKKQSKDKNHPRTRATAAGSSGSPCPPQELFSSASLDTSSTGPLKPASLMVTDTTNNPPAIPKQVQEQLGVEKVSHHHTRIHDLATSLTVDETSSDRTTPRYRERNIVAKAIVEDSTIFTPTLNTTTNDTTSTKFSSSSSIIRGGKVVFGSERSTTKHLPISLSNLPFQTPDSPPPPCMSTSSSSATLTMIPKK